MNDHEGCIILNMLNGIGGLSAWKRRGSQINALLQACGSVSAVFEADAASLSRIGGISETMADRISRWREFIELDRELETAKNEGAAILCRTDDEYPDSLRGLANPPLCLYLRGALPAGLADHSIAIVGTREPTEYGISMARSISESAAHSGWATVSGLASGIDSVAHRTTIDAGGKTIAVLGFGLSRLCSSNNYELARDILRTGGAAVSEYPMNTEPTRYTLPRRNRIIAGLSGGTLVIEAGEVSGALITAAHAMELGRRIFAVRGEPGNPTAAGCDKLIRQGAKPVLEFNDILDDFR